MNQLAIHGGQPAIPAGPPTWPIHDEDVLAALRQAFADGSWGQYHGRHGERLSASLSAMHSGRHVLLCSSGTIAVELALRALKVGEGDEVVLAGYDFSGNFRAIESVGARPVLVDVDPETWCLDPAQFERALHPRTRAVIVSHLHGGLAPLRTICDIAARSSIRVVEDACQSPGAIVQGRVAGTWGDVGILSFGGSKLLTAGRGGALLTAHDDVHQRGKIICERGNDAYPLSELQAAVLLPQLEKLATRNNRRLENAFRLQASGADLRSLQMVRFQRSDDNIPSFYKLAWLFDSTHCGGVSRADFIAAAGAEGVAIDAGFRGFTRRPAKRCERIGDLPHSQRAVDDTVLLHHPVLLQPTEIVDRVACALRKVTRYFSQRRMIQNSPSGK